MCRRRRGRPADLNEKDTKTHQERRIALDGETVAATASNWRTCPNVNARRNVPNVLPARTPVGIACTGSRAYLVTVVIRARQALASLRPLLRVAKVPP